MTPAWIFWRICFPGRKSCQRIATRKSEYDQRGSVIRIPVNYFVNVRMVVRLRIMLSVNSKTRACYLSKSDYIENTHTKPHGFRVGIITYCEMREPLYDGRSSLRI